MSDVQDRATRASIRMERSRDAARATLEYEAKRLAVLGKTERLRALRLQQEAGQAVLTKTKSRAGNR